MVTAQEARLWLDNALAPDELAHHGVLGQKWGVRHDTVSAGRTKSSAPSGTRAKTTINKAPTAAKKEVKLNTKKDTKLTAGDILGLGVVGVVALPFGVDSAQKAYGAAGARFKVNSVLDDVKNIKVNTSAINQGKDFLNSKVDTSLPANTVFHRVASYAETEVNAPKYATYLESDVLHYRKTWITPGRTSFNKHFITKMEALKPVTIASPDSIISTFEKHLHTPLSDGSTLLTKFQKEYPNPTHLLASSQSGKGFATTWADASPSFIANYIVGHNRASVWGDEIGHASSEVMQKAGYGAVTDINNTGSMSRKHAVIVLDKTAFKVTSRKLSLAERSAVTLAEKRLRKIATSPAGIAAAHAAATAQRTARMAAARSAAGPGSARAVTIIAKAAAAQKAARVAVTVAKTVVTKI